MGMKMNRGFNAAILLAIFLGAPRLIRALDIPDKDDDVQIPEGYEEKRYPVRTLVERPLNFRVGGASFEMSSIAALSEAEIAQIVRYCAAPESWSKHGPARIESASGYLTIVQKKEVHAEIEKVLQWLQDNVRPAFRATVVTVSLKPEVLRALTSAVTVPTADLLKAVEEAGEGNSESVELRGIEGQQVAAQSGQQQRFVRDYDVSGAVFDPVVTSSNEGLSANAAVYRNPDCASVQIDLSVSIAAKIAMQKATIQLIGVAASKPGMTVKEVKKDDKGKPIDTPEKHVAGETRPAEMQANLVIDLPNQTVGGIQTSLSAPQGAFVLAGTVDFALSSDAPGKVTAVFVRASVGSSAVPTLTGVSGLKEGESFRLYPLNAGVRAVPNFQPLTPNDGGFSGPRIDANINSVGGAMPFAGASMQPPNRLADTISKAQKVFNEKVRKNKLVDEMGPVLFTRLVEADHALALKNLMTDTMLQASPAVVHAVALALPQAAYRKLQLADNVVFEAADIEALSGNGANVLVDTELKMIPGQQASTYAGVRRNVVWDYDISGDSYDPVIKEVAERGYALDLKYYRAAVGSSHEVEIRFQAEPAKVEIDRMVLDSFSINSGADTNALLGLRADLDKTKSGAISIRTSVSAPSGKFVLAGATKMPTGPDGKVDARQAVLFVRVGDGK